MPEMYYICDAADAGRTKEFWISVVTVIISGLLAVVVDRLGARPLALSFIGIASCYSAVAIGNILLRYSVHRAEKRWRHVDGTIEFLSSWGYSLWEQLTPAFLIPGCLVSMWLVFFSPAAPTYSYRGIAAVTSSLLPVATIAMWRHMPLGRPGPCTIRLTPHGISMDLTHRQHVQSLWEDHPRVMGIETSKSAKLIILDSTPLGIRFHMASTALGYVQLQRVVEFYSTHPELRDELATGTGLNRVRTLMHTPVWQVEESLSAARSAPTTPGRQDRSRAQGTASPRRAITPVDDAIASLAAMLNGRPVGSSPMPARPAQVDEPDELDESDEPAVPARPPLPEPPPPTPTPRGALGCEKADRRRRSAPLRFLLYALMVFILFTRLPTGEDSAFIHLVFIIALILLLHAVVLLGAQIPVALSTRRWTRRIEGISISRVWFLPLAKHLGALILALLGLLGYFLVLFNEHFDEKFPIPSLCAATACLAVAVVIWWRTPRPRLGAEIILDTQGFRTAPGTRRETTFLWVHRPRVVGVSASGAPLVQTPNTSPLPVGMDTTPLGYVQFQRVVEFYSTHPELRDELATDTGLNRVRTLMHTPVWQIDEDLPRDSAAAGPQNGISHHEALAPVDDVALRHMEEPPPPPAESAPTTFSPPVPMRPDSLNCASADQRRGDAPRRAVLQVLGVFACLVAVLATGLETTMVGLLFFVLILLMMRAIMLRVLQIPLKHADRRWTIGHGGIELPSFWLAPLTTRLGAAALAVVALFGWSMAISARPYEEQLRLLSIAAVVACAYGVIRTWRGSTRPHGGPEVVLTPNGIRFGPDTRRDMTFLWEEQPQVAGALKSGHLLVHTPDVGLVSLPMDAVAVGYTQLRQVIEFYSTHPELRDELATDAGLSRVRTLMRTPV